MTNRVRIYPQSGWPGLLEASITYTVGDDGLIVTVQATNLSDGDLPFGYAAHPYLTVGEDEVDEVEVTIPAASYLEVDDRLLPVRISPVDRDRERSARRPACWATTNLDTAMTDLARDADGRWRVTLRLGERSAELWADETMNWVQVFTGGPYRDWSLAVEPMTCGPDAFNPGPTHDDLIVLGPGETYTGAWGIRGR